MSVELGRTSWNEHGDPTMTITVVGVHDVYRLAHHLETGQVEFGRLGRLMIGALKRKLSKSQYRWLHGYMHGDGGYMRDYPTCPDDTDGDGNCGRRSCPICRGGY